MSKGSRQRPVDRDKFNENYERIFGRGKTDFDSIAKSMAKSFRETQARVVLGSVSEGKEFSEFTGELQSNE